MAGGQEHGHKMSSWIVVALLVVACVVLAFAFVLKSIPLAVVGLIVGIIGVVMAGATHIMDDAY